MEASFAPTSRGGAILCHAGRMRRYDKPLAGLGHRWKCAKYDRAFKRKGFDVTNGEELGAVVLRTGVMMNTASQKPPKWTPRRFAAM